jgi:hypothetical protein
MSTLFYFYEVVFDIYIYIYSVYILKVRSHTGLFLNQVVRRLLKLPVVTAD